MFPVNSLRLSRLALHGGGKRRETPGTVCICSGRALQAWGETARLRFVLRKRASSLCPPESARLRFVLRNRASSLRPTLPLCPPRLPAGFPLSTPQAAISPSLAACVHVLEPSSTPRCDPIRRRLTGGRHTPLPDCTLAATGQPWAHPHPSPSCRGGALPLPRSPPRGLRSTS